MASTPDFPATHSVLPGGMKGRGCLAPFGAGNTSMDYRQMIDANKLMPTVGLCWREGQPWWQSGNWWHRREGGYLVSRLWKTLLARRRKARHGPSLRSRPSWESGPVKRPTSTPVRFRRASSDGRNRAVLVAGSQTCCLRSVRALDGLPTRHWQDPRRPLRRHSTPDSWPKSTQSW